MSVLAKLSISKFEAPSLYARSYSLTFRKNFLIRSCILFELKSRAIDALRPVDKGLLLLLILANEDLLVLISIYGGLVLPSSLAILILINWWMILLPCLDLKRRTMCHSVLLVSGHYKRFQGWSHCYFSLQGFSISLSRRRHSYPWNKLSLFRDKAMIFNDSSLVLIGTKEILNKKNIILVKFLKYQKQSKM